MTGDTTMSATLTSQMSIEEVTLRPLPGTEDTRVIITGVVSLAIARDLAQWALATKINGAAKLVEEVDTAAIPPKPGELLPLEPGQQRRRRATAEPELTSSTATVDATAPVATETGRRRRATTETPASSSTAASQPTDGELTDADVAKAASDAAARVTPVVVRQELAKYLVSNIGELDQAQRASFVAALKALK